MVGNKKKKDKKKKDKKKMNKKKKSSNRGISAMSLEEVDLMLQELGWKSKLRLNLREKKKVLRELLEKLPAVNKEDSRKRPSGNRDPEEVDVMLQELAEYVQNPRQPRTRETAARSSASATAASSSSPATQAVTHRGPGLEMLQQTIDELRDRLRKLSRDTDVDRGPEIERVQRKIDELRNDLSDGLQLEVDELRRQILDRRSQTGDRDNDTPDTRSLLQPFSRTSQRPRTPKRTMSRSRR